MQQDEEIADFLRDLVRDDGDGLQLVAGVFGMPRCDRSVWPMGWPSCATRNTEDADRAGREHHGRQLSAHSGGLK